MLCFSPNLIIDVQLSKLMSIDKCGRKYHKLPLEFLRLDIEIFGYTDTCNYNFVYMFLILFVMFIIFKCNIFKQN